MPDVLAERYHFAHDVAVDFHDILVHIIKDGLKHGLLSASFKLKSPEDVEAYAAIGDEPLLLWLENHGYMEEVFSMGLRSLFVALVTDFCHYVLEGLTCAKKGKITVAWTLFRKAFKDNLFYLEWMLADPNEFLHKFHNEGPSSIDISNRSAVPEEKVISIITDSIHQTRHPGWASGDFIYRLRYSKQHPEGLERTWNKASHLITNVKTYATEPRNFNFIFSRGAELQSQWEHIYYYVPFLLYHSALVVEALAASLTEMSSEMNIVSDYHRDAGFYLWSRDIGFPRTDGVCIHPALLFEDLDPISCPACGGKKKPTLRQLKSLYGRSVIRCHTCKKMIDLMAVHYAQVGMEPPKGRRKR